MKRWFVFGAIAFIAGCAAFSSGLHGGGPPVTTDPTQLVGWGIGSLVALFAGGAATGATVTHVVHRYIRSDGTVVETVEDGVTDKNGNVVVTQKDAVPK